MIIPPVKIVMVGARRRVGKDTFSDMLRDELNKNDGISAHRTAFARELKLEVQRAFPQLDVFSEEPELKEKILRPLFIAWGQARRHQNPHYWVDKIVRNTRQLSQDLGTSIPELEVKTLFLIISDWRFPNELLRMQEKYPVTTVHIERPNIEAAGVDEIRNEPICKAHAQHHVYNGGSLEFLEEAARKVARALLS